MPDTASSHPPRSSSGPRVAAVVTGALVGLFAFVLLAAGGVLVWANAQKDDDGYVTTGAHRYATATSAIATDNLDVDLDGAGDVLTPSRYGKVRLQATSRDGKPLFIGIARTADVQRYLGATAHDRLTDVDYRPFHATYHPQPGARAAGRPADQRFWAASATGTGTRTMTWDVEDGSWSIVLMNADGSPGVSAAVKAGADVPFLSGLAAGVTGGGIVLLIAGGALVYAGLRRPRQAPPAPVADDRELVSA